MNKELSRAKLILGCDPNTYCAEVWRHLNALTGTISPMPKVRFSQKLRGGFAYLGEDRVEIGTAYLDKYWIAVTILHELCHLKFSSPRRSPRDTGHCKGYNQILANTAFSLWGVWTPLRRGYRPSDDITAALEYRKSIAISPHISFPIEDACYWR